METAWIVVLSNGEEFLCPDIGAAKRTYLARRGPKDACTPRDSKLIEQRAQPKGTRAGEYRWRPNAAAPWGDWPEWRE